MFTPTVYTIPASAMHVMGIADEYVSGADVAVAFMECGAIALEGSADPWLTLATIVTRVTGDDNVSIVVYGDHDREAREAFRAMAASV